MTSTAELDAAVTRLRDIRKAKDAGVSWADIGAGLGVSGPEAKRDFRRLERATRREYLLAAQAQPDF